MSADPCDFAITSIHTISDGHIIRVEAKDGIKILARIDIAPSDFTAALLDQIPVIAAITMVKP